MRVEEIDARTAPEELLLELHDAWVEAHAEQLPGEPPLPFEQHLGYLRHPGVGVARHWLARDGDVAGVGVLAIHGPEYATAEVCVRPSRRREGIGTALLDAVVSAARAHGATSLSAMHATPPGTAFAARVGAEDRQRDVRARLDLRAAELPPPPGDVDLRTWIGVTPEELLPSYVQARRAMDDAPTPGEVQFPEWTIERQRTTEEASCARGRPPRVTVALEDGEIVAFTDLRVSAQPPAAVAMTDDTATVPSARGRGLATAVKLESLRRLRDERPDVQFVVTLNAEENGAMRAVNAKAGFVPVTTFTWSLLAL